MLLHATFVAGDCSGEAQLAWVPLAKQDFAYTSEIDPATGALTAWVALQEPAASISAAALVQHVSSTTTPSALLADTTAWWARYWPQSFVTLPTTRVEGMYYAQMFRFPASDRSTLMGLDGAFGPSGMPNYWPDYVWDMNQQVRRA